MCVCDINNVLAAGLPVQNGHVVRREDSRSSLFLDPGTPDSIEVRDVSQQLFSNRTTSVLRITEPLQFPPPNSVHLTHFWV